MAKRTIRRFDAASYQRTLTDWLTSQINDFDSELKQDTPTLRSRSRDASINDVYARRYFRALRNNVIGPNGIQLKMVIRNTDNGTPDVYANTVIETEWNKFIRSVTPDKMTMRELLGLVVETVARDGEIFLVKRKGEQYGPYMLTLQVLEAEYCDIKMNGFASNGNEIRNGIEYDSLGAPAAFYFWKSNPEKTGGLKNNEKIRIEVADVLHIFDRERASQGRGFPWLSAALVSLKHLKQYEESELVAARVASAKMGFFTRPQGENQLGDDADPLDPNAMLQEAEPGMFDVLPDGYNLQTFDPENPNGNFPAFVKTILRGVAASVGVSYNLLANDLESTSYSSLRQGAIDERETFKACQQWLIDRLLTPVFEEWLEMLLAFRINGIRLPLERYEKFNAPSWRPRTWAFIDVQKETAAIKMQLDENIRSRTDVVRQMGFDYVDVLQEIAQEQELAKVLGVVIEPTAEASKTALMDGSFMDDGEDEDEEEDSEEDDAEDAAEAEQESSGNRGKKRKAR